MKIAIFGDGEWASRTVELLSFDKNIKISLICGRYKNFDKKLREISIKKNIKFVSPKNVNDSEFITFIKSYNLDIIISIAYNQIFKKDILNLPKISSINCHAGKLPFYRGRNILNWALINDEKEIGITVHSIDQGIDTGDIIIQKSYKITDNDNYRTLLNLAYVECPKLVYKALSLFQENKVKYIKQTSINKNGFYCRGRVDGDEIINWNSKSREIFNFVRALVTPGPCATTYLNKTQVKIRETIIEELTENRNFLPGSIIYVGNEFFIVKTKNSSIKVLDWESNLNFKIGDRFE